MLKRVLTFSVWAVEFWETNEEYSKGEEGEEAGQEDICLMDVSWLIEIVIPDDDDEHCQTQEETQDDDKASQDDGDEANVEIDDIFHQRAADEDCLFHNSALRPNHAGVFLC